MTAKENALIEKAKRVLDEIGLKYEGHEIKISYDLDPIILEMDPERANDYRIFFSSEFKFARYNLISVSVDRKTHKLKMVTTKYNMYEVPEELS
jgi:hypothetical protein